MILEIGNGWHDFECPYCKAKIVDCSDYYRMEDYEEPLNPNTCPGCNKQFNVKVDCEVSYKVEEVRESESN